MTRSVSQTPLPAEARGEKLSQKAVTLIQSLTGAAAWVQQAEGEGDTIDIAVREWAIAKSDLSRYVAELESALVTAREETEPLRENVRAQLTLALGYLAGVEGYFAIGARAKIRDAIALSLPGQGEP